MSQSTLQLASKTFLLMSWSKDDATSRCRERRTYQSCEKTTVLAMAKPTASTEVAMETRVAAAMAVKVAQAAAAATGSNNAEAGDPEVRAKATAVAEMADRATAASEIEMADRGPQWEGEITRTLCLWAASVTQTDTKWKPSSSRLAAANLETSEY